GVADRGGAEYEDGVGPVVVAEAPESTQHHRHVGPEDAPERVELVDHYVAEPVQEVGPPPVVGEYAHVQHVGVREDHARRTADGGPVFGGGVAVVGGGRHQ